ncbi:alpha-L-glutamate ligase-like protein [Orbus mooreae]|uniref:alpha-L-glutamate ligase-like protein n=1 Tax=Orbus mooreae TaxID=3074107 RepID=UPI00370DB49E
MISLIKTWQKLNEKGVMGINQRNADYILKYNNRRNYPLVDDKILTKERAIKAGISVPELYGIITTEHDISQLNNIIKDHRDFVIKPAQGSGGDGIIVIADRYDKDRYKTVSGRLLPQSEIEYQLSNIITGLYSLGGMRDQAIIEYRVKPDPIFKSISYEGVPDLRVIVLMGYPIMAMLRLPTRQSNGKANLHQGAIGVGVDLATGITLNGSWFNEQIVRHPDTDNVVSNIQLPMWDKFIHLATSCYELVDLGYIGVDLVLDETKGPLILELNARPGLNIQIANDVGLHKRASVVEAHIAQLKREGRKESVEERIAFSTKHFSILR